MRKALEIGAGNRKGRTRAPRRAVRGTLTFLFTDLVGSTALTTSAGDRAAQEHLRVHARIIRACIEKNAGHTMRFVGDSFMVTFESALDAVACAADMQRGLTQHNRVHPEQPIHVRIGLHCGEAIREKGDFYGAAVNAAARICAEAEGGQILVSALVKELVAALGNVDFIARGERLLKGFPQPWPVYEVVRHDISDLASTVATALDEPTPFIGRQREVAKIKTMVEAALEGRGGVAMLAGEPGVGKSRLAVEAAGYAVDRGFSILTGQCYEVGGPPAYGPFVEALEPLVRRIPRPRLRKLLGDGAAWVAKLLPGIKDKLEDLPPAPPLSPDQERHFLLNSVVEFVVHSARRKPILLVLEDLHWSDKPTQLLLRQLSRTVHNAPVVVIGTVRDAEVDAAHPFTDVLTELHRQRDYAFLPVRPFGADGVNLMLLALAQDEPPATLVETIYGETEGNPLFVEEFIKLLLDEERLFDPVGNWVADLSARTLQLPRGVSLVIGRRLSRLSPPSREALTTAAVIGRHFCYDVLETATAMTADALAAALDEAAGAHLIDNRAADGDLQFTFAHELVRQTLYRELPPARREQRHLSVAEAMENVFAPHEDAHAAELSHHYMQAGSSADARKTCRYLVVAGDQAMAASAFETALGYYQQADRRLPPDDAGRADLLFKLGTAQQSTGDWDAAARSWESAASTYETMSDGGGVERVCYALSLLRAWRGQFSDAFQVAQQGLLVAPESTSEARCRLLSRAGTMLSMGGQSTDAEQLFEQALAIAERRTDGALLGSVLAALGAHQRIYLQFEDCLTSLTRAQELLRASGDLAGLALCYNYQLPAFGYLGRLAEMESMLNELHALVEKLGDPAGLAVQALLRGVLAWVSGDLAAAEQWAHNAEDAARRSARLVVPAALQLTAEVEFAGGRWERIDALSAEAAGIYAEMGIPPTGYVGPLSRFGYLVFRGDRAAAQDLLPEVERLARLKQPISCADLDGMAAAAIGLVTLDMREHTSALYTALAAMADRGVVFASGSYPLLHRILGMLATVNEWWDQASRHYETALRQAEKAEARKEAIETRDQYGRMLLRRNRPDDRTRGRAEIERSIDGYRIMGMTKHLERAQQLLVE